MTLEKDPVLAPGHLLDRLDDLFTVQEAAWADLARGLDGLRQARERAFDLGGFPILARHLPSRMRSTTAPVDAHSISARPCFLCPAHRPREQAGIPVGPDFEIFCNPFPILEKHVTIVCRDHVPQRLRLDDPARGIRKMLGIARVLPGFMVLYNGPASGASAPDHLHFQAAHVGGVPVFGPGLGGDAGVIEAYPGSVIVIGGCELESVGRRFDRACGMLPMTPGIAEPMMNVAAAFRDGRWEVRLFPRARHRPGVFDRGEFTWSPGAIDMCGIAVLPAPGDLERLTAEIVAETYREVSLSSEVVRDIASRVSDS